jgi:hypothetical protein
MKKFIINITIFSIALLVFSFLADFFISKELRRSGDEYSVWNDIIDGKVNSNIVIYGSSRAWVQIDPTTIGDSLHTSVYNLGIDGHNFWLEYLRHKLLLEHNFKPKLIIFSLDIYTLQKREDLYNSDQFLPYMLFNKEIENATISYKGFSVSDYYIPLIRYYGNRTAILYALKSFIRPPRPSSLRVRGYLGQEKTWNSDFEAAEKKIKYYEVKLDTPTIKLFERFLTECKNNNIKIIFVYTPEYIKGQKFIKNRNDILSLFTSFSKQFDIPFYDFSNDSLSFQKKYFYNAEHLNKTGSELFTKKLISILKNNKYLNLTS